MKTKRILALVLSLCMIFTMLPAFTLTASAATIIAWNDANKNASIDTGETTYETISAAISAGANGSASYIRLNSNVTGSNWGEHISSGDFTLDLNGYTYSAQGTEAGIWLYSSASLTITDTSDEQTGTLSINATGGGTVNCYDSSVLTIEGGTFSAPAAWLGSSTATVNVTGGTFKNHTTWGMFFTGSSGGYDNCINVTGGSFQVEPKEAWLEEGYTATYNSSTSMYEVSGSAQQAANVASVTIGGSTENFTSVFTAVEKAIAAEAATVTLLSSISTDSSIIISGGNVTIDMNGNEITTTADQALHINGGKATVKGNGRMTGNGDYAVTVGSGSLTIENGNYSGKIASIYMERYGTGRLTVISGSFTGGSYGIRQKGGTVTVKDGTFTGSGEGVDIWAGTLNVEGGTITGQTVGISAGIGATGDEKAEVVITGGSITGQNGHELVKYEKGTIELKLADEAEEGARFPNGISVYADYGNSVVTLADILDEGLSYWKNNSVVVLADGQTSIEGDVVVGKTPPHTHNFTYKLTKTTTENDTIEATCANCEANEGTDYVVSVTINAPESLTYTGEAITATVTQNTLGITADSIIYDVIDGELTNGKPVNKGTYKASITLGEGDNEKTAYVTYKIERHLHEMSAECAAEGDNLVEFTKISTIDELKAGLEKGGSFYLGANIGDDTSLTIAKDITVNLCLNGKTLDGYFNIKEGGTLNLCDCTGKGMLRTDETGFSYVPVRSYGTFSFYGGTIKDNAQVRDYGAVTVLYGSVTTIAGGTIISNAYAFEVSDSSSTSKNTFKGKVNLQGGIADIFYDWENNNANNNNAIDVSELEKPDLPYTVGADFRFFWYGKQAMAQGWVSTNSLNDYFAGAKGFYVEKTTDTNEVKLYQYKIETQPTSDVPTVVMNNADGASYQWYLVTDTPITDQNATAVEGAEYKDGAWLGTENEGQSGDFFKVELKAGQQVVVYSEGSNHAYLTFDTASCENDKDNEGNLIFTVPEDGTYTYNHEVKSDPVKAAIRVLTPIESEKASTLVNGEDTKMYQCMVTYENGTELYSDVITVKAKVTFDVSNTEHIYESDTARNITFTSSHLTANDFVVKYYKVDENNGVLESTTPVKEAIETGKYLYVIDFKEEQKNYKIANALDKELDTGTGVDNFTIFGNTGYMFIKSGITGQQTPIYFKDGIVNLKVNDTYTNELTNENTDSTVTYKSSNSDIVTVDENGEITAKAKGSATITATSEKDETTPVYASYTVNVGLATKTLTVSDFVVTAQDKVYNGTDEVKISAVLANDVAYEGDNIKVDITGEFASADASETGKKSTVNYTITGISGTGAENYILENGQITGTTEATINKATVTIICAENTTRTYDGEAQTVDVSAMANGEVFDSTNYTVKYNGGEAPTGVDEYKITVELTDAAAKNYQIVKQPNAKLVIKAATQDVFSIEGVPERVYYGDSFTVSENGAIGAVTYTVSDNVEGKDIATVDKDSGEVVISGIGKVTITAKSVKDGHVDRIATKTFEAHKRVLTPTAEATDRIYNGENGVEVSIALGNVLKDDEDEVSATATGSMKNADVGEDKIVYVSGITLDGDKSDLYTLDTAAVQTTVDIAQRKITSFTFTSGIKTYDGSDEAAAENIVLEAASATGSTGVLEADKAQVSLIGTASYGSADAGEYNVTYTATALTGAKAANYTLTQTTATTTEKYEIEKMEIAFAVGTKTFVYDNEEKQLIVSANDKDGSVYTDYTLTYKDEQGEVLTTFPKDAGTYTVEFEVGENYFTTQEAVTLTIAEATQDQLVIAGLPGTVEYKDVFELEAVGGVDGGELLWEVVSGDATLSDNDSEKTNVEITGTGKVEIKVTKTDANYKEISAKVVFKAYAKSITFELDNLEQTYGNVSAVTVEPSDDEVTTDDFEITYDEEYTVPKNAGKYKVKVVTKDTSNYSGMQTATLVINKAVPTGTITMNDSDYTYTYGDTVSAAVNDNTEGTAVKITYAGTGIYVPQEGVPTKVGNYAVIAEITGDNYETLTLTQSFEIKKATLEVWAKNAERDYGEANPIFELEYNGFITGEDKNVLLAEPVATVNANASSEVGTYNITVSGGSAENYAFDCVDVTADPDKGKLTVKSVGGTLYITGSTNTAYVNDVFTLHAFMGNSKVDVTWESSDTTIATISDNGEVEALKSGEVTFTAKAGSNYNNATAEFKLKVKQSGIILTPTSLVKTYTGERQDIEFVDNADFEPVIGENVKVEYTLITDPSVTEPIQAGTYSVVYTISDGSYTGGGTATMYINKATVVAKVKDDSKVYGDEYTGYALEFKDKGTLADSVLESTLAEIKALATFASEGAAKTAVVKDGGYEMVPTPSQAETDNVKFTVENGTLTVTKAPLTVKVKDVTREFGAENPTLEAEYIEFKNGENKDVLTGDLVLAYDEATINAETPVGIYTGAITATGTLAADNYEITYDDGDVTITTIAVTASAGKARTSYLTIVFDKAVPGLTKDNFAVMNGETPVDITEVTASGDNKTYTLKGTFDKSVTYTVTTTIENGTHVLVSGNTLSIQPSSGGGSSSGGSGGGGGGGVTTTNYTVKFETNGAGEIEAVKVAKNKTLAEPTEPAKDGYTFAGWFTDKGLTKAYDFEAKVTKSFTLYAKWEKADDDKTDEPDNTDTHNCPSKAFDDLDVNAWYHLNIDYVLENGLMKGTLADKFAPDDKLTRAMLVTVLYRAEGEPAVNRSIPFADIDMGMYYASAVIWAQQNGIVKGVSETEFAPDESITREQIAAILYRYAIVKGMDAVTLSENLGFADADQISEYAISAMNWAVGSGLIKGYEDNTVRPLSNATRAEIAAILHRFIEANK